MTSVDRGKKATKSATISMDPSDKESVKSTAEGSEIGGSPMKKLSLYVGNFPWWTSDVDLMSLAQKLGVNDISDIIFAENRDNGQSRGYAEVVVTSEESLKVLLEKVPRCNLHGEPVECRLVTQQNLSIFEEMANIRIPLRVYPKDSKDSESAETIPSLTAKEPKPLPTAPHVPSQTQASKFPSSPSLYLGQQPPPYFPHMPPNIPPPPPPPPNFFPQFHSPCYPPSILHLNPAHVTPRPGHSSNAYSSYAPSQRNNADLEELMSSNRTVATTAITKAVTSATVGNVRTAVETLLTAISVIKQSRVYDDIRCQELVTSLKDCLVSIQGDYRDRSGTRSTDNERNRDRGRDRERDRDRQDSFGWEDAGTSRRYRTNSWSEGRDRENTRSQEWPRDYRDRYR